MNSRLDRISVLVGQKVSQIIYDSILDPDEFFTVTQVAISSDLSYCDVEMSFLEDSNILLKKIKDNQKKISFALSKSLKLRKSPKLRFHLDKNREHTEKIEDLLDKL